MRAGRLDRRITIQRQSQTQSATSGQITGGWVDVATVWAEFNPLRGRERFAAQQVMAELDARFRIRWRDDVDVTMRVLHDGDTYNVEGAIEIGRREGLELLCSAVVPAEVS